MSDYIFSVRSQNKDTDTFDDTPGTASYLIVPEGTDILRPSQSVDQQSWVKSIIGQVQNKAIPGVNNDIIFLVHGYNASENDILNNHRLLKQGLSDQHYIGEVISFDWPCGNQAIAYLSDRHFAKMTAMELVDGGIMLLANQQDIGCNINIHLLAHSTGAYVVREAFEDADDANKLPISDWMVSQLMFISGDISSSSMSPQCKECTSLYYHCIRFTNYYNPYDAALALSNAKRVGFENRVGRVGMPMDAPAKCVDVDCGPYYKTICDGKPLFYSHSWYFTDPTFMNDLYHTIQGNTDRNYMATRKLDANNELLLIKP